LKGDAYLTIALSQFGSIWQTSLPNYFERIQFILDPTGGNLHVIVLSNELK